MPEIISGPWAEIVAGSRAGKATPVSESGALGNFFQDVRAKLGEKLDPAARGMDAVKTSDNRYLFSASVFPHPSGEPADLASFTPEEAAAATVRAYLEKGSDMTLRMYNATVGGERPVFPDPVLSGNTLEFEHLEGSDWAHPTEEDRTTLNTLVDSGQAEIAEPQTSRSNIDTLTLEALRSGSLTLDAAIARSVPFEDGYAPDARHVCILSVDTPLTLYVPDEYMERFSKGGDEAKEVASELEGKYIDSADYSVDVFNAINGDPSARPDVVTSGNDLVMSGFHTPFFIRKSLEPSGTEGEQKIQFLEDYGLEAWKTEQVLNAQDPARYAGFNTISDKQRFLTPEGQLAMIANANSVASPGDFTDLKLPPEAVLPDHLCAEGLIKARSMNILDIPLAAARIYPYGDEMFVPVTAVDGVDQSRLGDAMFDGRYLDAEIDGVRTRLRVPDRLLNDCVNGHGDIRSIASDLVSDYAGKHRRLSLANYNELHGDQPDNTYLIRDGVIRASSGEGTPVRIPAESLKRVEEGSLTLHAAAVNAVAQAKEAAYRQCQPQSLYERDTRVLFHNMAQARADGKDGVVFDTSRVGERYFLTAQAESSKGKAVKDKEDRPLAVEVSKKDYMKFSAMDEGRRDAFAEKFFTGEKKGQDFYPRYDFREIMNEGPARGTVKGEGPDMPAQSAVKEEPSRAPEKSAIPDPSMLFEVNMRMAGEEADRGAGMRI